MYDDKTDSLCCPSPNYCCPNSLASCASPQAVLFDAIKANVSAEVVVAHWPLMQNRPFRWLMTPRSVKFVADAWRAGAAKAQRGGYKPRPNLEAHKMVQAANKLEREHAEALAKDCARSSATVGSTYCRG